MQVAGETTDLPSSVEEIISECPQFRILIVGKSGVGKSSLLSAIFNIPEIDIAHQRPGNADIRFGYTSPDVNPRFILHDSQGWEPGLNDGWDDVEKFMREKSSQPQLRDQIHAVWLCILSPRKGMRMLHSGDEKLLKLSAELKIPVIVVFTQYDLFIKLSRKRKNVTPEAEAQSVLEKHIKDLERSMSMRVPWEKVSANEEYPRGEREALFRKLSETTMSEIKAELWIVWASAQQVHAGQKIEETMKKGFQRYWFDLGESSISTRRRPIDFVVRIHQDILEVWCLYDPEKLLTKRDFFSPLANSLEQVLGEHEIQVERPTWTSRNVSGLEFAKAAGSALVPIVGYIGIGVTVVEFLYREYEKSRIPKIARFLAAYAVSLTIILNDLFRDTMATKPPRALTQDLVSAAISSYQDLWSERVCSLILEKTQAGSFPFFLRPGEIIEEVARELLGIEKQTES